MDEEQEILQALQYANELQQEREECEHGIHPDSGHPCGECLAAEADYQQMLSEDPGYSAWLSNLERKHGLRKAKGKAQA
jgi:hypothetical protein